MKLSTLGTSSKLVPGGKTLDEPIPKLPRSRGFKLSGPEIFRILLFAGLLFGVLALRQPCSEGIGTFVESFEVPDAGPDTGAPEQPETPAVDPRLPGNVDGYIRLTGDMSEEEIRAKLEQAGVWAPDAGPVDATIAPIVQ